MLNKSNSRLNNRDLNNPFEMKNTDKPVLVGFLQKKTTQNCVVGMGKAINLRQLKNQFPD
ncbi:hypothetical protein CBG31_03210 [Vibrio cholerae O139]|nr:hypothetical protein F0Q05_01765 [Vibrio cholerae]KJX78620.1 hypothetical protein WB50_09260 [Vibrio cholerae O1 biovar El Tor]OWH65677.1 hypothetical protein CBG31_03210 [Vibrio cholerae O139]KJX83918.1 hypothetical protein WG08_05725 [Vibrio cholerae]MBW3742195.1 hypothetical protein [Vibrio cholerae]